MEVQQHQQLEKESIEQSVTDKVGMSSEKESSEEVIVSDNVSENNVGEEDYFRGGKFQPGRHLFGSDEEYQSFVEGCRNPQPGNPQWVAQFGSPELVGQFDFESTWGNGQSKESGIADDGLVDMAKVKDRLVKKTVKLHENKMKQQLRFMVEFAGDGAVVKKNDDPSDSVVEASEVLASMSDDLSEKGNDVAEGDDHVSEEADDEKAPDELLDHQTVNTVGVEKEEGNKDEPGFVRRWFNKTIGLFRRRA